MSASSLSSGVGSVACPFLTPVAATPIPSLPTAGGPPDERVRCLVLPSTPCSTLIVTSVGTLTVATPAGLRGRIKCRLMDIGEPISASARNPQTSSRRDISFVVSPPNTSRAVYGKGAGHTTIGPSSRKYPPQRSVASNCR
uniref:Putative secreted protein n=1 Tax=Anopheles darlingi TaxID=43151 RepID=A0A2M4D4Z2_ANODA